MKIYIHLLLVILYGNGWAMPATDGRECTFAARSNDFQQVIIVLTGTIKDIPSEGDIDAPITVIMSLVDGNYKPTTVRWMLPRTYYGGGLRYKNETMYLLAVNQGQVVWELSREVSVTIKGKIDINIPLTEEDIKVIISKKK